MQEQNENIVANHVSGVEVYSMDDTQTSNKEAHKVLTPTGSVSPCLNNHTPFQEDCGDSAYNSIGVQ